MGNHRAARGSRRAATTARASLSPFARSSSGGARKAGAPAARAADISASAEQSTATGRRRAEVAPGTTSIALPSISLPAGTRRMPSIPALAGVAALAVAIGGALVVPSAPEQPATTAQLTAAADLSDVAAAAIADRDDIISRDSRREERSTEAESRLVAEAESAVAQREAELQSINTQANKQAAKLMANRWHMPVSNYRITATFGLSSYLWSSVHTGLDFAAPGGTPLTAVANGTITEIGYAGAYGLRTILTLDDGTEIWYCHQSSTSAAVGDTVAGGEVIGAVGSTGRSTGDHLHLEIRPGGGDPVNPMTMLQSNGVNP